MIWDDTASSGKNGGFLFGFNWLAILVSRIVERIKLLNTADWSNMCLSAGVIKVLKKLNQATKWLV